jgi:Ca2+-dependent lipid-binding protein
VPQRDAGLRNPYVKFKVDGKLKHRSQIFYKSLNPRWAETFNVRITSSSAAAVDDRAFNVTSRHRLASVRVVVRDHSFGQFHEYMGETEIDTNQLMPNELVITI